MNAFDVSVNVGIAIGVCVSVAVDIAGIGFAVIDEPERPRHARLPSDLLRLIGALVLVAVGLVIVGLLDDVSRGLTVEVIDAAEALPDPVVVTGILAVQMVAWFSLPHRRAACPVPRRPV